MNTISTAEAEYEKLFNEILEMQEDIFNEIFSAPYPEDDGNGFNIALENFAKEIAKNAIKDI